MYDYIGDNWSHWNSNKKVKENVEAGPGRRSVDSLQGTVVLVTFHIIRKVVQSETGTLSGGDRRCFKRSTRK